MTSNQVTNSQFQSGFGFVNSTNGSVKTESADFSSFLANSEKKMADDVNSKTTLNKSKTEANTKINESRNETDKVENRKPVESTEKKQGSKTAEDVDDRAVESVKKAIEEIKDAIEETLEVTSEDIDKILAELGFTQLSLLVPENVTTIALNLSGAEDVIEMATNNELYENVTEIVETVKETVEGLEETLDVIPEEFKEAILNASKEVGNTLGQKTPETLINVKDTGEDEAVSLAEEKTEVKAFDKTEGLDVQTKEIKNFSIHQKETGENKGDTSEEMLSREGEDTIGPEVKAAPVSFVESLVEKTLEALNSESEVQSFSSEQTEMILNQITEKIKIDLSPENTEISLKLHPETLGNISVKVSSNSEGVMTAQFTAQNESVKAVLESQAIVLKENLEAKGVSVEAIEVMVGSHEFERNLSDSEGRGQNQPKKQTTVRRINLSEAEEEEIDDEDIINREMMRQNGNTIDYTA